MASQYVKTAISIPEDLLQAVKEHAGDKPLSTTVCDLLRVALGQAPEVIPGNTGITDSLPELTELVKDINTRLSALELERVIPGNTEVIPVNETVIPEVIPEVIPDCAGMTAVIPMVIPEDAPGEYTLQEIQAKVKDLQKKYGSYGNLLEKIGRKRTLNTFSKLVNEGINYLTPEEIRKIMEEL